MAEGPSSLFERYNPEGALGGLFAPAYVAGYAPSEQAVMAWTQQNRPISANMIDELRLPEAYRNPPGTNPDAPSQINLTGNIYGQGNIPQSVRFGGDPRGPVDPMVLRAASQGGRLNVQQLRDRIAQRMAENAQAEAAYRQAYQEMIAGMGQGQLTSGSGR